MSLSEELKWRGFVNQTTYDDITAVDIEPITFYWGVDPSASSMTIGNLAIAMMVRHFIEHGHKAILLVGGATGMIGDPDGKSQERELKTVEEIEANKAGIVAQYRTIFAGQDFELVDNFEWFSQINYLQFLRTVGKNVPLSQMLDREFISSRLGEVGSGISYAEFSYSLIQGYDFLHLFKNKSVRLQVAGSDQWGNSLAGVDLIRRIEGQEAHVWSAPLVINKSSGLKFGKTEDGAIWLDEKLTSVYKFYQFWLNADDLGVIDYLKIFTMLPKERIAELVADTKEAPGERNAQKALAYEVTKLIHGQEKADGVQRISETLFGGHDYKELSPQDFFELKGELGSIQAKVGETPIIDLLVDGKLASSRSEARRFMEEGAIYINGSQFSSEKSTLDHEDIVAGHSVLRRGRNNQIIVEVV